MGQQRNLESSVLAVLARVVVDMCIFFDFADDDTVDRDAAVMQLEILADGVNDLSLEERRLLSEQIRALAAGDNYYANHAEFIRDMPGNLGLEEVG